MKKSLAGIWFWIGIFVLAGASSGSQARAADETVNFAPPYSATQSDDSLSDLFDPDTGKSELCMPTTIANIFADQAVYRTPNFPKLQLVQQPGSEDYTQQVRYFANLCHTDPVNGTHVNAGAACIRQFYKQSGYDGAWAYIIGADVQTDPVSQQYWHGPMALTIDDIRYFLGKEAGVIMDVEWEVQAGNTWTAKGGHSFMLAGYDYDFAWGATRLDLRVVNPVMSYPEGSDHFDVVSMTSTQGTPGVNFPPGYAYTVTGNGFPTTPKRGYVKNIVVFFPDGTIQP